MTTACAEEPIRTPIAVIGGGAAALSAALALRARGLRPMLIAPSGASGEGVAYSTREPWHLLNVCAARMSIRDEQPADFLHWLQARDGAARPQDYYPRADYGAYLAEYWRTLAAEECCVAGAVSGIACGWRIATDGGTVVADHLVLAVGVPPARPLPGVDPTLVADERFALDPYRPRHWPARGMIIGSGLTAVDCALSWAAARPDAEIVVLSRHGRWPMAHDDAPRSGDIAVDLRSPLSVLRSLRAAMALGVHPAAAVDSLRDATPSIWAAFSSAQRRSFLRHARSAWDHVRHRMAPRVAGRLRELERRGQIRLVAGRFLSAQANAAQIDVAWRPRRSQQVERRTAELVVQCTGFDGGLGQRTPWLQSLIDAGLASVDEHALGVRVDRRCRVLSADGVPQASLFLLGALARGSLWECIAIPEIRRNAAAIAAQIAAYS